MNWVEIVVRTGSGELVAHRVREDDVPYLDFLYNGAPSRQMAEAARRVKETAAAMLHHQAALPAIPEEAP